MKSAKIFNNFEDADRADDEYYMSLSPEKRVDILLELVTRHHKLEYETPQRFARVYRITELSQS
jgi:hypothetical protein